MIRICALCQEEFDLKPNHKGFANKCAKCQAPKAVDPGIARRLWQEMEAKAAADAKAEAEARYALLRAREAAKTPEQRAREAAEFRKLIANLLGTLENLRFGKEGGR